MSLCPNVELMPAGGNTDPRGVIRLPGTTRPAPVWRRASRTHAVRLAGAVVSGRRPLSTLLVPPEFCLARNELPRRVQELIERHCQSAADVDVLLLLCREHRDWTAAAVANELRIDPDQAAAILARLQRKGLLRAEGASYRFQPRDPSVADAVRTLAELYPAYRVAIVALIYARPTGPIRDFSDAFRLRKED